MNYLKVSLFITISVFAIESKGFESSKNELLAEILTKKCGDFGSVEYFDLDKKQSCLNLLELGLKSELKEAKAIFGKALYNGFNVTKNTDLGQKLITQSMEDKIKK